MRIEILSQSKYNDSLYYIVCALSYCVQQNYFLSNRNHSLSKSYDGLPTCLAFVKYDEQNELEVLGFSKVSSVQGIKNAGLIESGKYF